MKKRVISLMLLFIIVMAGLPGLCIGAQATAIGFSANDKIDGNIRKGGNYAIYTPSSWASYEVTADEDGYYGVTFTYLCLPQDTGNLGDVEVSISSDSEDMGTFTFRTKTSDTTKRVGYVKLSKGSQTIKFTAGSERGFRVSNVKLEPIEPISIPERAEKRVGATQYILSGAESESLTGGAVGGITNDDGFVSLKNNQEISYLINISKAGNYDFYIVSGQRSDMSISVNDGEGTLTVPSSGNLNYGVDSSVCTLALDEGDHIIKLTSDTSQMSLFGLYIANSSVNVATEIPADSDVIIEAENYNRTSGTADDGALLLGVEEFAKFDVDVIRSGEYEITVCYLADTQAGLSLSAGNETHYIDLAPSESEYSEATIEGVILEEGKSTLIFTVSDAEISADFIKIRRTGNLVPDLSEEITFEAEEYFEAEGTEIVEVDDEALLEFTSGGEASYSFNALEDATYQIKFNGINDAEGKAIVLYDDNVLCEKTIISKGDDFDIYVLCNVNVTQGKHTIKLVSENFSGKIDTITVKKLVVSDDGAAGGTFISVLESSDRKVTNIYRGEKSRNPEYPYVGMYECHGSNWADFAYDAPKTGKYEISVIAGSTSKVSVSVTYGENVISSSMHNTGHHGFGDKAVLGYAELKKGKQTIRFTDGDGGLWVWGIIIRPIEQYLEINAVMSDDIIIANDTVLPKGTSQIDVKFGSEIESAGKMTLESEDGDVIPLLTKAEGNTVSAFLCEALKDDTSYVLTVSDTKGIYGGVLQEENYCFTTGGEDYALDKAFLTKNEKINDTVNLSYVVKTGADVGIKGRDFEVTLKNPAGEMLPAPIFLGKTEKNGVVDVAYSFSQSDMSGMYTFIATSEYTSENPVLAEVHFISDSRADELLGVLKDTNEDTVKAFFEENERELGINISEDMKNVPNPSKVYAKFAGSEFDNFDKFREMYSKAVFTETVNQATGTNIVNELLADSKTYEITGINKERVDIISANSGNQLVQRIVNLKDIEDPDLLISAVSDIVDNELLKTAKKKELTLKDAEISIYHGEAIEIPIEFNETENNIKSLVIKIKSDDTTFDKELTTVSASSGGEYSCTWNDNELTVVFAYEKLAKFGSAGYVVVMPKDRKSAYDIKVSGEVFYDEKLNETYDISENILVKGKIPEKNYSVAATSRPQSNSSGGTSGGSDRVSSSGTGNAGNIAPMPQTPQMPPKAFEFTDINNIEWAKESINELLKLGVISESEDGLFNPNDNITREQFVKLVVEALGLTDETAKTTLSDVDENAWFYKYISSAEKCGVVMGSDGKFGIGENVTREDMAVIIKRAMELKGIDFSNKAGGAFSDDDVISDYAKTAVYGLKEFNIINGTGNNQFTPKGNATRAQAAKMIYEMIKVVNV